MCVCVYRGRERVEGEGGDNIRVTRELVKWRE